MTEKEKLHSGDIYFPGDPEIHAEQTLCQEKLYDFNQTDLLFYNTLFDENAVCHLALGAGFSDTIRDHHNKTLEECQKLGINDSMIHVDFMIGCDSMNIDAICADGSVVPVFRGGNWAK